MRRFQQLLAAGYAAHPPLSGLDLHEARRIVDAVREPLVFGGPRMARTTTVQLPDAAHHGVPLTLRLHHPTERVAEPALVYLHGGGWVYFSIDTHDRLMRELAARSGRIVIGVDYAHAPEARFPVALEQAVAAWDWALRKAALHGIDPARVALGGDSVGANLALAAALRLRDRRGEGEGARSQGRPDALLLNYGVYSDDDSRASYMSFDGPRYTLERAEMRSFWGHYLRDAADRADPLAMPLQADLHGLPRCCLVVADCDVLRDDSLALADRLGRAGVPVDVQRHPGAPHSFLEAVSFAPTAREALDRSCAWLRGDGR